MLALVSVALAACALAYKVRNAENKKQAILKFFGCADDEPPQIDDQIVGHLEEIAKNATLRGPGTVEDIYFQGTVKRDEDVVANAIDAVVHPPLDHAKIEVLLYAPGSYLLRQRDDGRTSIAVSCKPMNGGAIVKMELHGTPSGALEEKKAFFAEARSFANSAGAKNIVLPADAGAGPGAIAATSDPEELYDSYAAVVSSGAGGGKSAAVVHDAEQLYDSIDEVTSSTTAAVRETMFARPLPLPPPSQASSQASSQVASQVPSTSTASPGILPNGEPPKVAGAPIMIKALHPYSPTAPDQVAMTKGDLLTLLDGAGNWWKVKAENGTEGLVPSNYVEKVAPAEDSPKLPLLVAEKEGIPLSSAPAASNTNDVTTTAAEEAPLPVGPAVSATAAPPKALPGSHAGRGGSAAATQATPTASASINKVDEGNNGNEEGNPFADAEGIIAHQEDEIYEALFKKKAASITDDLGAVEVAALLRESGLDQKALKFVWSTAKKDPAVQHGLKAKMNFDEFVLACKLAVKAGGTFAASACSASSEA